MSTISRVSIPIYTSLEPFAVDTNNSVSMETHPAPSNFSSIYTPLLLNTL